MSDAAFITKLRQEYNLKYSQQLTSLNKMTTPLIFGTPVRSSLKFCGSEQITDLTFDRKLRMVRADLFALMSCATNSDFVKDAADTIAIKKSLFNFFKGEMNARAKKIGTFEKLTGWNKLLHLKCNKNSIYSVHNINQPECILDEFAGLEEPGDGHYVFASFLKPGYHQFYIYDPLVDKAFCQEFVIEQDNCFELYPELAKVNKQLLKATLPEVFKKWIRDDIERENKAFYTDTSPFREHGTQLRDNFEPERFIKDPLDLQLCEDVLTQNFKFFQIFFQ